jgi:acetate kinase
VLFRSEKKNQEFGRVKTICDISAKNSKVKVLVIPTNEELVIARETDNLTKIKDNNGKNFM